jgi:hypothetical protein
LAASPLNLAGFVADRFGSVAKSLCHARQCRRDGLADAVGGLRGTGGRASAEPLEIPLQRPQAPLDFSDIRGDGARVS